VTRRCGCCAPAEQDFISRPVGRNLARRRAAKEEREQRIEARREEEEVSSFQTIWSQLTWPDKAMIGANLIVACIFFVSWRRKKRRIADAAKNGE
jgi:hypothetical protein